MIAFERGQTIAAGAAADPPVDLAPILRKLGLEVVPWRFAGRVREMVIGSSIGIDDRLPEPWVRWLTAHAIGHHLLHTGTSLYLESWQWVNRLKAERQAEEFAAGLLVPHAPATVAGHRGLIRRYLIPEAKADLVTALTGAYTRP